jgi:hypothetical protein
MICVATCRSSATSQPSSKPAPRFQMAQAPSSDQGELALVMSSGLLDACGWSQRS